MLPTQPKTRVFISCGQASGTKEEELAIGVRDLLVGLGFDAYMAGLEHTQKEVMQSVFDALAESEYFLFIDFKRERIRIGDDSKTKVSRGSLFTHQVLAIASFLGIEQLRFSEKGVEWNGISKLLQGMPIEFEKRKDLLKIVRKEIQLRQWSVGWKNGLQILDDPQVLTVSRSDHGTADFYQVVVENMHSRKLAVGCRAYLEFEDNDNLPVLLREHLEQKWEGVLHNPSVAIRSGRGFRRACICFVERDERGKSLGVKYHQFGVDTDSEEASRNCPPGEYVLLMTVVSANFAPARKRFKLVIDDENEVDMKVLSIQ